MADYIKQRSQQVLTILEDLLLQKQMISRFCERFKEEPEPVLCCKTVVLT